MTDMKNIEESRRLLTHNIFIGNYSNDKLNIYTRNVTKVTNNYTAISTTFKKISCN